MVKTLEAKPSVRLVEKRVGALTVFMAIATIVASPGTEPNGARKVRVDPVAK